VPLVPKTKVAYVLFFTQNCTSILQLLDQGKPRTLNHYYHKQLVRDTVSVFDLKLLHDASLMWINFFDSLEFILESLHNVTHVTIVHSFQKCRFNLNLTNLDIITI